MSLYAEKIIVRDHERNEDVDVAFGHNTICDCVTIRRGEDTICLSDDEFDALAVLMIRDFVSRESIEKAIELTSTDKKNPYRIFIARTVDDEKWNGDD
ncbi:MAG: hypothetical protein MR561_10375 [Prevotella sp.]|nr:hypothetical protein [Prevotella sp.]